MRAGEEDRLQRYRHAIVRALTRTTIPSFCLLLAAPLVHGAEADLRFAKRFQIPGFTEIVTVAEGDFEPRSIGSYALRVYGGSPKKFPTDDFIAGLVQPRNGTVEAVRFADIDGDDKLEIVVMMSSTGSGGHVSADAFHYESRSLSFVASVANLDRRADPIQALRQAHKR